MVLAFGARGHWFKSCPELIFLPCIYSFVSLLRTLFVRCQPAQSTHTDPSGYHFEIWHSGSSSQMFQIVNCTAKSMQHSSCCLKFFRSIFNVWAIRIRPVMVATSEMVNKVSDVFMTDKRVTER